MKLGYFLFISTFLILFTNISLANEDAIDGVQAKGKFSGIEIKWNEKNLPEFGGFILIRTEENPPADIEDGEEVYRGNGGVFFDKATEKGKIYYYGLAAIDNFGNITPLGISEKVSKMDFWPSLGKLIGENYIIVVGPFIIIILAFLDYFTRARLRKKEG